MADNDLAFWAGVWLLAAAIGVLRHWRSRSSVGLVFTYIMSFGAIHWLAASMYLLPWYSDRGEDLVAIGLREATVAMVALAIGTEVVGFLMRRATAAEADPTPQRVSLDPLAVNVYFFSGLLLYGVISPLGSRLSGLQALVATGSTIIVVALGLKCWNGW